MSPKRIALVCMTPAADAGELEDARLPSYGIRRILAATIAAPELEGTSVALIDHKVPDVEAYVQAILDYKPDLIGFSVYLWSTPTLAEVARRVKRRMPEVTIIFGGPSARTALFDLSPYRDHPAWCDAIVASEGEMTFVEIARSSLSRSDLEKIAGLDLPVPGGWKHTAVRPAIKILDDIPSPFQLGLMEEGSVAYLETYRGCPFNCRFCEWGATEGINKVFSQDYLMREFEAFAGTKSREVYLLDAGLNLNARAFRNLNEAAKQTGFLKKSSIWCEIYPSYLTEEHIEFLDNTGPSWVGIGLQSIDPKVLKGMDRPFGREKFETVIEQLNRVAIPEIQIIEGLPGDTPEGFRQTLAYARSLPASVRIYHCLILPDALLTRDRPEWEIEFDPITMQMTSCVGWSPEEILEVRQELSRDALAAGGSAGDFWWKFPPPPLPPS